SSPGSLLSASRRLRENHPLNNALTDLDQGAMRQKPRVRRGFRVVRPCAPKRLWACYSVVTSPSQGWSRTANSQPRRVCWPPPPDSAVVEDVSEQAADLQIGRPPRDGLEIDHEGADELVVLRGVAPDPPARQPTLGEPAKEGVRHGRMALDLAPRLP